MEGFDNQKPSTFLWLIDANNLYGGIMEKYPLPLNNFIMASSVTLQKVLETEADSEVGYIVEVDIEYPQVLHEAHSDFPLAPTKEIIKEEWLSNDQRIFFNRKLYSDTIKSQKVNSDNVSKKELHTALFNSSTLCTVRTEGKRSAQGVAIQPGEMVETLHRVEHREEKTRSKQV